MFQEHVLVQRERTPADENALFAGRLLRSVFGGFAVAGLLAAAGHAEAPANAPKTVEVPSGTLRLMGHLWTPPGRGPFPAVLFNHGSGGADPAHTAGLPITEAAERLASTFLRHGYAFLYPFRRGQGLSADQAPFMQDLLQREKEARGDEARRALQFNLLTNDHLEDAIAALSFLKTVPEVDSRRIAVAGHSFGGQLTLLAVERDPTLRAAVTFAAAADSWEGSPAIRERLRIAVGRSVAPVMFVHAANDYSTAPGRDLDRELERLHKAHLLKIYPPVGRTPADGHNFVYLEIPQWEADVFAFVDAHLKR